MNCPKNNFNFLSQTETAMRLIDFVMQSVTGTESNLISISLFILICVLSALPHRSYIRAKLNQLFKR